MQRFGPMKTQLHVVFRGFSASPALAARIDEEVADLERIWDRITACRVSLERPHRRKHHGDHFLTRIELFVPGKVLVVGRDPPEHESFEDAYAALNEAFDMVRRQLREYARVMHGRIKRHQHQQTAVVSQLFPDFGFLRAGDGREIYFHRNAVLHDGWNRLDLGARVAFAEEAGDEGPQASTVRVMHGRARELHRERS